MSKVLKKLQNLRNKKKNTSAAATSTKRKPNIQEEEDYDTAFFGYMNDDSSSDDGENFDPSIYGSFVEKEDGNSDDELSGHVQFSTNSDDEDDDEYNLTVSDLQNDNEEEEEEVPVEQPKKKKKKLTPKELSQKTTTVEDDLEMNDVIDEKDKIQHNSDNHVEETATSKSTTQKNLDEWTEDDLVENNSSGPTNNSTWKKVKLSDEDAFACEGMYSLEVLDENNEEYKSIMRSIYGDDYDKKQQVDTAIKQDTRTKEEIKKERNQKKRERKARKAEEKIESSATTTTTEQPTQSVSVEQKKDDEQIDLSDNNNHKETKQPQQQEKKKKNEKQAKKEEDKTTTPKKREKVGDLKIVNDNVDSIPFEEIASKMTAWNFNNTIQLHEQVIRNLYRLGFYKPTPIQEESIPKAISQQADILAAAETGSGKTLAFVLPIIDELIKLKEKEPAQQVTDNESRTVDGISLDEIGVKNKRKKLLRDVKKDMFQLRSLILLPTRELALQVYSHIQAVIRNTSLKVVSLVGGLNEEKQIREIHVQKPDIIVATPGRYWCYIDKGMFASNSILGLRFLVIDEADRMVADGHFFELQSILRYITIERFKRSQQGETISILRKFISSATLTFIDDKWKKQLQELSLQEQEKRESSSKGEDYLQNQEDLAEVNNSTEETSEQATTTTTREKKDGRTQKIIQKILAILDMKNPVMVDLTTSNLLAHTLQEAFLQSTREDKVLYLYYFLTIYSGRTVVFANNIKGVRFIGNILKELFNKGPNAKQTSITIISLHGKMDQQSRFKNLERFKKADNSILITTDIFARGIDIPDVENVVHFNIPIDTKTYIHRCGRSGRAGKQGFSVALVSPEERKSFFGILKDTRGEGSEMPVFPISHPDLLEVLRKRVSLAIEVEKLEERKAAKTQEQDWFIKQAAAMDIDLDERFFKDVKRDKDLKLKGLSSDQERKLSTMKKQLEELLKRNVFMQTKTSLSGTNRLFTVGDPRSVDLIKARLSNIRENNARGELEVVPTQQQQQTSKSQSKKRTRNQKKHK